MEVGEILFSTTRTKRDLAKSFAPLRASAMKKGERLGKGHGREDKTNKTQEKERGGHMPLERSRWKGDR